MNRFGYSKRGAGASSLLIFGLETSIFFKMKLNRTRLARFSTTIFCLLASFQMASAQTVFGKIVEASTQLPLEFAAVSMHRPDSSLLRETTSNRDGIFRFNDAPEKAFFVEIRLFGYENQRTPLVELPAKSGHSDLGLIALQPSDILLKGVEVVAEKAMFLNEIDRKVYFPGQDLLAQTGSVSDILQNIPSVSVDADGVVSVRGSSNITFLVNGKRSLLLQKNSAAALEQIPANTIERIELITNPSAKYRPDGTAGILNIVLKKNKTAGFNGSATANFGADDRFNSNLTLNFKPGNVNFSGSYGYRQNFSPRILTDSRRFLDAATGEQTAFELASSSVGRPVSHTVNLGLDWAVNSRNDLGLTASFLNFFQKRNQQISTILSQPSGVFSDYKTDRRDLEDEAELEISATAEHRFKKEDHAISLEIGFDNYDELEDGHFTDSYVLPAFSPIIRQNTIKKNGHTTTATLEYTNPIGENLELEAGYEGEFFKDDLDFEAQKFDAVLSKWTTEPEKTNRFLFSQNIHAAFATLSKEIEDFGILAGLRAEQTNLQSNLVTLDSIRPNHYFKLFPTAHLSLELSENSRLGLSYSRRINRPDSDELNPFPEFKDPRNIEAGNPDLKPEQVHSIELGYELKRGNWSVLPTLFFRSKFDGFAEVTRYVNDTVLLTSFENLARDKSGGLELIFGWAIPKKGSLNLNANFFQNRIDASNLGFSASKSIVSFDAKMAAVFQATTTTKFQVNANYRAAGLTAQGRSLPVFFVNAGLRQAIFKQKAALSLTASDVFNTMRFAEEIDTPELFQKTIRKRPTRIIYLGFSWRFGLPSKKTSEELMFEDRI